MDAHTFWRLIHILSSTVLFGTGLGIAFFAWFGYQRALAIGEIVIQILMSRKANRASSVAALGSDFHKSFVSWFVLGVPAFLIVLGVFYLMVAKPLPLA